MPKLDGRMLYSLWLALPSGCRTSRTKMAPSQVTFSKQTLPTKSTLGDLPKQHCPHVRQFSSVHTSRSSAWFWSQVSPHQYPPQLADRSPEPHLSLCLPCNPSSFDLTAQLAIPESLASGLILLSSAHIQSVFNYLRNRTTFTIS